MKTRCSNEGQPSVRCPVNSNRRSRSGGSTAGEQRGGKPVRSCCESSFREFSICSAAHIRENPNLCLAASSCFSLHPVKSWKRQHFKPFMKTNNSYACTSVHHSMFQNKPGNMIKGCAVQTSWKCLWKYSFSSGRQKNYRHIYWKSHWENNQTSICLKFYLKPSPSFEAAPRLASSPENRKGRTMWGF